MRCPFCAGPLTIGTPKDLGDGETGGRASVQTLACASCGAGLERLRVDKVFATQERWSLRLAPRPEATWAAGASGSSCADCGGDARAAIPPDAEIAPPWSIGNGIARGTVTIDLLCASCGARTSRVEETTAGLRTPRYRWLLFDWGDTLMSEDGPEDSPMALWPEVRVIDGAREVLAELSRTYRIAVATNASVSDRAMVARALARGSLGGFISEIFCSRDLGVKKADAAFWDAVVARLGVARGELLMVGDNLDQDVLGPRRCGIAAVWLNWKKAPVPADTELVTIDRLADLPAIIAAGRP